MTEIRVREALPSDCEQLARLREELWPESSADEHARELVPILAGRPRGILPLVIFVAETSKGVLAGFLEVGLRSHADGCDPSHPVGFVEGWFVSKTYRKTGLGARLMKSGEEWARKQGCVEMASDTWIDHDLSRRVHEALKFELVDCCAHYRKML